MEYYSILEPFLILDPLLLPSLVNICLPDDLPTVFSVIPTYLSAAQLLKLIKNGHMHSFTVNEVTYLLAI